MKECTHKQQEVIAADDTRTQVCVTCRTIIAKWAPETDHMIYELPTSRAS